jgi:hypothetical protein
MIGSCRFSSAATHCRLIWSRNQIVSCLSSLSLPFHLLSLFSAFNNTQPAMSQSDLLLNPPSENTDAKIGADLPFFAPPPQCADAPSPESFDKDVDKEVGGLEFNWDLDQFEDFYSTYRNTIPAAFTPSAWTFNTYSTDTGYEFTSSQYSYGITPSASEYSSIPSDIETHGSVIDGIYITRDSSSLPALPGDAKSDYGTYPNFVGISPSDLSSVQQSATCGVLPVHVVPVLEAQTASFKPFKCLHCPFGMSEPI